MEESRTIHRDNSDCTIFLVALPYIVDDDPYVSACGSRDDSILLRDREMN